MERNIEKATKMVIRGFMTYPYHGIDDITLPRIQGAVLRMRGSDHT